MTEENEGPPRLRFESAIVGADALRGALRRREREGGSVAVNLVLEGCISPNALVEFLLEKTGLSRVSESVLQRVTERELELLPPELIYDGAIIPLGEHEGHMLVGMCDPADEALLQDVRLVAGQTVEPSVLSLEDMSASFETLVGRQWRVRPGDLKKNDALDSQVRHTLEQAAELTQALNEAYSEEETLFEVEVPAEVEVPVQDQPGETQTETQLDLIVLSRSRRTAAATLERAEGPVLTAAERPRIKGKEHGASRHYLDPVKEGEAVLLERNRAPRTVDDEPKIIVDLGPEETEEQPAATSSSVIIDPALLEPEPEPEPEPESEPEPEPEPDEISENAAEEQPAAPREFKLGVRDQSESESEDEWARLSSELDDLDESELDLSWPFASEDTAEEPGQPDPDSDQTDSAKDTEADPHGASTRRIGTDEIERAQQEAARMESMSGSDDPDELTSTDMEIVVGPTIGEASVELERSRTPAPDWFDPDSAGPAASPVSDDLRDALHEFHRARDHQETWDRLAQSLSTVYERAIVMRIEGDTAIVEACDSPRTSRLTLRNHTPEFNTGDLPALRKLLNDPSECFHGQLSRAAVSKLSRPLAGGPALSAVICPIQMHGRVIVLLYADAGPGRECPREPKLWRLMRREVPRVILRLLVERKRRRRWEVKG